METLNVVDEINNAGNWLAEHQVPLIKYAVNRVTSNNMPPPRMMPAAQPFAASSDKWPTVVMQ